MKSPSVYGSLIIPSFLSLKVLTPYSNNQVNIWEQVFVSLHTVFVIFKISGTTLGGIDVLSWTESTAPMMRVSGLENSRMHYVTVTGVNKAGLYTTIRFTTSYPGS